MFPLGHIGITAFLATLLYLPAMYAVLGVLTPDIFDKIFFNLGILPCGRSLGHSVFFAPVLGLIVLALTRKKNFAIAVALGAALHLVQDSYDFLPLFYPIASYVFDCPPGVRVTPTIFEIGAEVVGLALIVSLIFFKWKVIALRYRIWKWYGATTRRTKTKIRKKKK